MWREEKFGSRSKKLFEREIIEVARGLDRYGDLREAVDWKGDITFHKTCKLKVCFIVTVIMHYTIVSL